MKETITDIPKEAFFIKDYYILNTITKWYCPNCGAQGDDKNIDFVNKRPRYDNSPYGPFEMAEFCCSECYEPGIYIIKTD